MPVMDDIGLLTEITVFAGEVATKPRALPPDEWAEQVDFLDDRLAAAILVSAYRHLVGNFAPLLLTALRRALAARRAGDERNASRWESLAGHLIPCVRDDAGALLDLAKRA